MAKSIMSHRVHRGSLVHQIADVQFVNLKQALCAASAAHGLQDLQAQRRAALATTKTDIRRDANRKDAVLTADNQSIAQRARKVKRAVKPFVPLPTLPAIHLRVAPQDWGVVVEYVGPSLQRLHAAGCVTDRMMKLWASGVKGGKKFRDENGDGFRRWPRRSRAYPQGVQVTRNIHDERNYRALPGVGQCLEYVRTARHEARPTAQINTLQVRP